MNLASFYKQLVASQQELDLLHWEITYHKCFFNFLMFNTQMEKSIVKKGTIYYERPREHPTLADQEHITTI
jgi:hypothetical protein